MGHVPSIFHIYFDEVPLVAYGVGHFSFVRVPLNSCATTFNAPYVLRKYTAMKYS